MTIKAICEIQGVLKKRQKKWLTKSADLCWKGIGRTPTIGGILKTYEKLTKHWIELLLVGSSETNNFNQKQFD